MNQHKGEFDKAWSIARVTYKAWAELWELCEDCQTSPAQLGHALEEIERKFEEVQPYYVRARACVNQRNRRTKGQRTGVLVVSSVRRTSSEELPF